MRTQQPCRQVREWRRLRQHSRILLLQLHGRVRGPTLRLAARRGPGHAGGSHSCRARGAGGHQRHAPDNRGACCFFRGSAQEVLPEGILPDRPLVGPGSCYGGAAQQSCWVPLQDAALPLQRSHQPVRRDRTGVCGFRGVRVQRASAGPRQADRLHSLFQRRPKGDAGEGGREPTQCGTHGDENVPPQ